MSTAVLFVHGIQSGPRFFGFLTEHLPDSVTVCNLCLPGHETTVREFRRSGIRDWLPVARDAARSLKARYDRVCFVGHSMGCLLGLLTEQEYPGTFSDMLLICCPFSIRPTIRYLKNSIAAVFPKRKTDDPYALATRDSNSMTARFAGEYLTAVHPYLELFRLIHRVKTIPERPACRLHFFYAERDEIVGKSSAPYAFEKYGIEAVRLHGCGHNYFTDEAKDRILHELVVCCSSDSFS